MFLANTGEGASGATVTTTDTTAGNVWDTVSIGTGHTITYDDTRVMRGSTSVKHAAGASSAGGYTAWTATQITNSPTTVYVRFYVWFDTLPSAVTTFASFYNGATLRGSIRTNANNTVRVADSFTAVIVDSTVALTAGAWYRIEVRFFGSSSSGNADLRLYSGDASIPLQTVTTGAAFNTGGAINAIRFGNTVPTVNVTYWLDDLAIADTGFLGSSLPPPDPTFGWGVPGLLQSPGGGRPWPWLGTDAGGTTDTWGPPSGLTVTPFSTTQLDLSWTAITGASGYDIERDGSVIAVDVAGTSYSDTGLAPNSTHTYRVRSVGA